MLEGGFGWVLIYIGVALAGVAIAYATVQWRKARKEETSRQRADRDEATHEMYRDDGRP